MKMDTTEVAVQYASSGDLGEMSFGIKDQDVSHIIVLLRQQMYKYPIDALCREVASNSRDANREVGRGHIPIRIIMGTNPYIPDSTCISFEDNGPGITPSRMSDVFICYGASTKRDTNEQTGGFGLGAKTPFAYTNHFIIETCAEGFKYTYQALIAAGNRGRMVLLTREEYFGEAPFGTRVTVPIKESDRKRFEDRCYQATYFWDVRPIYEGFDLIREMQLVEEVSLFKGIPLRVQKHTERGYSLDFLHGHHIGVLLDGIPYPLEEYVGDLQDAITSSLGGHNTDYYYFLECKPGDLALVPSRESLHYNDHTRKHIATLIDNCREAIKEKVMGFLRSFPRPIDALHFATPALPGGASLPDDVDPPEGLTKEEAYFNACFCHSLLGRDKFLDLLTHEGFHNELNPLYIMSASFSESSKNKGMYNCYKTPTNLHKLGFLSRPVVVLDTFSFNGSRNARWSSETPTGMFVVMTRRGKGVKKSEALEYPASKMQETLKKLGLEPRLYSEKESKAIVKIPVFRPNARATSNTGFRDVPCRVTFDKDTKTFTLSRKDSSDLEIPLEEVYLVPNPNLALNAIWGIIHDMTFQAKLEGKPQVRLTAISFDMGIPPVLKEYLPKVDQHTKVKEDISKMLKGKKFLKELSRLRQKEYLLGRTFPHVLLKIEIPPNNLLYPIAKRYREILSFEATPLTNTLISYGSTPSVEWRREELDAGESVVMANPLGRAILNFHNFADDSFLKEFETFAKTFFKKERAVCSTQNQPG
jgi:hypothetical protein